jgi:excisionase family DNA binding protein
VKYTKEFRGFVGHAYALKGMRDKRSSGLRQMLVNLLRRAPDRYSENLTRFSIIHCLHVRIILQYAVAVGKYSRLGGTAHMKQQLMTTGQAAQAMGLSASGVRWLTDTGRLPVQRVGRLRLIALGDLTQWHRSRGQMGYSNRQQEQAQNRQLQR